MGLLKKLGSVFGGGAKADSIESRRAPRIPVKVIPGLSFRLTDPMKVYAVPMVNVSSVGIGFQYCNAFAQLRSGIDIAGVFEYKGVEIPVKGKLVHRTFAVIGCELHTPSQELQKLVNDLIDAEARGLIKSESPRTTVGQRTPSLSLKGEHRSEIALYLDDKGAVENFEIALLGNMLRFGVNHKLLFQVQNEPPADGGYAKIPKGTRELFIQFVQSAKGLSDEQRNSVLKHIQA